MEPDWLRKARAEGRITEKGVNVATVQQAAGGPKPAQLALAAAALEGCNEAQFQDFVIKYAQARGWRVAHFRKVQVKRKGGETYWETPVAADGKGFLDLELVRANRLLKRELKVPPNRTTPEQDAWIKAYEDAGVDVGVWYPEDWPLIATTLE